MVTLNLVKNISHIFYLPNKSDCSPISHFFFKIKMIELYSISHFGVCISIADILCHNLFTFSVEKIHKQRVYLTA